MARRPTKFQMTPEEQKLAADNLNLARREAWRAQRTTGIEYSILESAAFEGLCKAAHRYDPDRPHPVTGKSMKFSSLAVPTIRGEIQHWIRDKTYAMRLSHKMRERWVKGRKMLYRGATDLEVAKELEITLEEWLEVRKACSGPPLELKDQATPSDPLEPSEVNFAELYLDMAAEAIDAVIDDHQDYLDQVDIYLSGNGRKIPTEAIDALLEACGCHTADWDETGIELVEGWTDLGNGRLQGSLF